MSIFRGPTVHRRRRVASRLTAGLALAVVAAAGPGLAAGAAVAAQPVVSLPTTPAAPTSPAVPRTAADLRSYGAASPAANLGSGAGSGATAVAHLSRFDQPAAVTGRALPVHVSRPARTTPQAEADRLRSQQGQATTSKRVVTPSPAAAAPSSPHRATFPGTGQTSSGFFPPDVSIAAGPYQVLEIVNGRFTVYNKNGSQASTQSDATFFSPVTSDGVFDPHVVYDEYIGRFVILETSENDAAKRSTLLLGISRTSDATGGWDLYGFNATQDGGTTTNNWCDYPHLGYSVQALYFTCNQFSFPSGTGSFQYTKIRIMSTAQFIGGSCCFWWDKWNQREGTFGTSAVFTIQPATMHNAISGDGGFLVAAQGSGGSGNNLHVYRVPNPGNCCVPGGQTDPGLDEVQRGVGNYSSPPTAAQPSGVGGFDAGDTRLLYAVFDWPTMFTGQDLANGSSATVSFTEFGISSYPTVPTPVNDWVLGSGGQNTFYPAVDANVGHDKSMVYSRSGTNEFADAYSVDIPRSGSCTFCTSGETQLHAGASTYFVSDGSRNRWGDYMGAARDPNGVGIWLGGEYVSATNSWGTEIALARQSLDASAPFTSATVSPGANGNGWVNSSTSVLLNSSDFGVAGVRRVSYFASGASSLPFTTINGSSASAPVTVDGTTTVFYQALDNWGNLEPLRSVVVQKDTVAPTVTGPRPTLATGGTVTSSGVPVSLSWSGSDTRSGIARYDLYRQTDGGGFSFVTSTATPASTVTLAPGHSYAFRTVAVDRAGNSSAATSGRTFTVRLLQESSSTIAYAGTWGTQTITGSTGGSVRFANTNGPTATLSTSGFAFAWVSTIASNRGSATVRTDGGSATTVNTNGAPLKAARLMYATNTTSGTHKVVVRNLGTAGHPRIDVDAFVVLS